MAEPLKAGCSRPRRYLCRGSCTSTRLCSPIRLTASWKGSTQQAGSTQVASWDLIGCSGKNSERWLQEVLVAWLLHQHQAVLAH
jgi:hypothetical protein